MTRRRLALAASLLSLLSVAAPAGAWTPRPARYGIGVRSNVPIAMRDGVVLRADVLYPTDATGKPAPGPFPVLVSETPYDKQATMLGPAGDGVTGRDPYLISRGYIQVIVDVRGTGDSGGTFVLFGPQETADSVQVIDWASRLEHSTGAVGMTGQSYLAIVQLFAAAAAGRHSPLKAIFPITAANDPYREILTSGGILNVESNAPLGAAYTGLAMFAPLPAAPSDPNFLSILREHSGVVAGFGTGTIADIASGGDQGYDEQFWRARSPGRVLGQVVANRVPAYLVGGLNDVYQEGAPLNYAGLQNAWAHRPLTAPMTRRQRVTGRYQLLMKPTYHSNIESSGVDLEPIKLAWFDRWLKGEETGIDRTRTPLHVIEESGQKLETAAYPPADVRPKTYYLGAGSGLTTEPPTAPSGSDTVVFTGASLPCDRSTEQWALGAPQLVLDTFGLSDPCVRDVVPSSAGPGQLVYTSAPFGTPTRLAGPIDATLYATATTRDTEWVVKLSDVAPDGSASDLTQGALLGSHRALDRRRTWTTASGRPWLPYHPYTRAAQRAVVPGALTRYDVDVRPTFATLRPGHRLRVTILTSQTPHLLPIPRQMQDLLGGVYRVQRSAAAASRLELPLGPGPTR